MSAVRRASARPLALIERLAWRGISAFGALLGLLALELGWYVVPGPGGESRFPDALEYHAVADLALLALGGLALVGSALPARRPAALLRATVGVAAAALVVGLVVAEDAQSGARIAFYGALLVVLGGVADLVDDRVLTFAGSSGRGLAWRLGHSVVLAVPLAVITWPVYTLAPGGGTDGSGPGGMHEAAWRGVDYGTDLVFTYGPLGFLTFARFYHLPLAVLSLAYVAVVHWALIAAVLAVARRAVGLAPALVLAFLAGMAFANTTPDDPTSTAITGLALVGAIALLRAPPTGRSLDLALLAGGALAGFATLIKPNSGVTIVALAGIVALFVPAPSRGRALLLTVGAGAVSFLVLWFGAGENADAILPYARYASEILSGYGEAGASEEGGRAWEYPAAAVIVALVLLSGTWATRSWARGPRIGALLALVVFCFGWFKGGFVHHDGHSLHFFAAMSAAGLAFLARDNRVLSVVAALVAVTGFTVSGLRTELFTMGDLVRPVISAQDFEDNVLTLLPGRAGDYQDEQRAMLRRTYGFDAPSLAAVRGQTVHFEPQEASAAWAYPELDWRPLPVFQTPFAFTNRLDELNADFLRSEMAPTRILRADEGPAPLESPRGSLEMYCRYDEVRTSPERPGSPYRWQTLARGASRCGAPRALGSVEARTESTVRVARAGAHELVFARIAGLELSLAESARKTLDKVRSQRFLRWNEEGSQLLVAEKAASPLVLAIPDAYDWTGPWAASVDARTLTAEIVGLDGEQAAPRPIRVEFFAVPLSRPAR